MRTSGVVLASWTIVVILILAGSQAVSGAENWPRFRGPTGLGYTTEKNLPITWGGPSEENVLWKSPLKGEGHASPIVWEKHLFVCTSLWPPEVAPKDREKVIPQHHVFCYSAGDGKLLWDTLVPPGPWVRTDFRSGPSGGYACPTPTTDGKLVYVVFASSVMAALDFLGKIVWRKELIPHTFDVTIGSSPVLYGDMVLMFCAMAMPKDSKMMAMDKKTGEVRWEEPLPKTSILKCWDAATGNQVYAQRLDGLYTVWASPVVDPGGRLFFATGGKSYVIQAGPEFRVLATNDLKDGNHPSPAVANGCLYLEGLKNVYCIGKKGV